MPLTKTIVAVFAVVVLLVLGIFYGIIPTGGLLDGNLDTESINYSDCIGNPSSELLDSKAYIQSINTNGHSEKIVATGSVKHKSWSMAHVKYYKYKVYLKENAWSNYDVVSDYVGGGETETSMYISNPNPGRIAANWPGGEGSGKIYSVEPYIFSIIGDLYVDGAIKVELWIYVDYNTMNPFDKGYEWKRISWDEAMLYSGYGGLYLPRGLVDGEDRPFDTFEIGQEVDIRVETAKGGYGTSTPWRVTLNEPYSGDIELLYDDEGYNGGGVVLSKSYANDVTNGHFKFTVTEEMARKSMESSEPYTIRIWNVMLPKGTLYVDFLDFIAKAPSDVEFNPDGLQVEVGKSYTIGLTSTSDIGVDYFRVSVIYGTNDVLLPSDPLSHLWLISTCNVGGVDSDECSMPQTVTFTPEFSSYITVHAKAFDVEGRGSVRTRTYTIWAYTPVSEGGSGEVPDEVIDDETGEEDYGGGTTPGYMPWDPEGGNWENINDPEPLIVDWIGVAIAFFIILAFFLLGFLYFGDMKMTVVTTVAGIVVAVLVYLIFFTNLIV